MLYTVAAVLIIAWLLGFISDFTLGGSIHLLPVLAVILIAIQSYQSRHAPRAPK